MKIAFLLILLTSLLLSCGEGGHQSSIQDFIPGTYVREVTNEYSTGKDTLIISAFNSSTYTIIHNSTYQRTKDGGLLPPERKKEQWTAQYDGKEEVHKEVKRGKVLSFQPQKGLLFVGSSLYKKIEQPK